MEQRRNPFSDFSGRQLSISFHSWSRLDGIPLNATSFKLFIGTRTRRPILIVTEAAVDECKGHLVKVRRWSPNKNDWESVDFPPALVLGLDNSGDDQKITQHSGAEKPLNVAQIRHSDSQIFPCVYGDIPQQRVFNAFRRTPGQCEAYQFEHSDSLRSRTARSRLGNIFI